MFNLKEKFGGSVFGVPASWYRRVAAFLNSLTQGAGILVEKPDNPGMDTPVRISVDERWLEDKIASCAGGTTGLTGIVHVCGGFEKDGSTVKLCFDSLKIVDGVVTEVAENTGWVYVLSSSSFGSQAPAWPTT